MKPTYDIELSREVFNYFEMETEKASKFRVVTAIRRADGERKAFKVDLKILANEEHWDRFLKKAVLPWVTGLDKVLKLQ